MVLDTIIGVMLFLYYQHNNCPMTAAAEALKNEYRAHKVIKFNLPISGNNDWEYLGVVLKGIWIMSLDLVSYYRTTQAKVPLLDCLVLAKQHNGVMEELCKIIRSYS